MVQAIEAAGGTLVQYTKYAGAGHGIWGSVFANEKLYKNLQKCELSDRYIPEPEPEGAFPVEYLVIAAAAVIVLTAAVVVTVAVSRKKKRAA